MDTQSMCLFDVQYASQKISTERSIRSFLTIFSQASVILFGGMGYPGGWICPGSGYLEGYPIGEVGISRGGMDMFRGGYLRGWVSQRGGVCMSRVGLPGGGGYSRGGRVDGYSPSHMGPGILTPPPLLVIIGDLFSLVHWDAHSQLVLIRSSGHQNM